MEQETTNKLFDVEGHHLAFVAMGIVLPAETDLAVFKAHQAFIGQRDAVRVAPKIGQHLLGTGERRFGINHPIPIGKGAQENA